MPQPTHEPSLEVIASRTRFEEIRAPWNDLATSNVFLTWDWLDCWWEHFAAGGELRVHAIWDQLGLVGGIALAQNGRHGWALANKETDLFRPVARGADEMALVLEHMAAGPWSRLSLPAVPVERGMAERMAGALRAHGWLVDEDFRERCPIIDTSLSLEDYRHRLSSNARRQLSKARRRLEREGAIELRAVEQLDPGARLEELMDECFRLEAAGWKGAAGSAVASDPRLVAFWKTLLERFHRAGSLRVSQLRLEGALLAFCLDVLHQNRLYSLKTSYDENFGYFSPGHVLRIAMIEASIEHGIDAQELLGPMLRWKERYATEVRTTVTLRGYRRTAAGRARYVGRHHLLPRLRPGYGALRGGLNRLRGRRGAAPAQSEA